MTVAEQVHAEEALARDLEAYAGKWVAVKNHQVIASADNLTDLLEETRGIAVDGVTQVPRDKAGACFF